MNPRRHLLARGYAATVIALRHLIPPAWIAAVVWASITLPDLASAPTAPLEDLAAKNGAASRAQARSTELFGFPLSTQTAVVQRNPRGLPQAVQRRQLIAARTVSTGGDPSLRSIRAALPISNAPRGLPARERGTTGVTYLFFAPDRSLDESTADARTYADRLLGGPSGDVVGVTGAGPARVAQFRAILCGTSNPIRSSACPAKGFRWFWRGKSRPTGRPRLPKIYGNLSDRWQPRM